MAQRDAVPPTAVLSLPPGPHRALAVTASKIAVTEPWWGRNNPENMADIHSVQEFVDQLVRRCAPRALKPSVATRPAMGHPRSRACLYVPELIACCIPAALS